MALCMALAGYAQPGLELPKEKPREIVVSHAGYRLAYNPGTMLPDWVAYELTARELEGTAERRSVFLPDPSPRLADYPLAVHGDYTRSGWVRGHMVPAGDLKYSQQAMDESFYTTNVCPMNREFNNGIWRRLEEKIRKWAAEYGRVYVITGPIVGKNRYGRVGESGIVVPDGFYKAVLVPRGDSYAAVGFVMENKPAPGARLKDCAVTLEELERRVNRTFFYRLDRRVWRKIRTQLPLKEMGLY